MVCFIKWLQNTRRFIMFGGWSSSIVISMLMNSLCSSFKGAVAMMGWIGALGWVPSCGMHHSQLLITFCICLAMPGHKNWSCSRYSIECWLASSILVTSIYGSHLMSHGDYKLHNFLQLTSWCMMVIESSLIEGQLFLLLKDGYFLLSVCVISQEILQILYFLMGNPINHGLKYWVLLLNSHPISHMQIQMCMVGSSLDGSFPDSLMYLFVSLSHHWVMHIWFSCWSVSDSIKDWLHSFCIQPQCNLAQGISSCIVPSLLVFNAKGESCKWFYPAVLHSI